MCLSCGKKEDECLYIVCISVKDGAPERHKTLIPRIGRRKSVTKQINVLPHGIQQRPLRLIKYFACFWRPWWVNFTKKKIKFQGQKIFHILLSGPDCHGQNGICWKL